MKLLKLLIISFIASTILLSCSDNNEIDTEKPQIDATITEAFPATCTDTIYFGEPFTMKLKFADNVELGTYNIDIHHNFDHHTHSTETVECDLNPKKKPINPYTIIEPHDIPTGQNEYITNLQMTIPSSDASGELFDAGDYHFHVSLTDKEGWSTQFGMGIKMVHR